jgi:outer membrane protein OmpA-like peptidoglycan-associated protein
MIQVFKKYRFLKSASPLLKIAAFGLAASSATAQTARPAYGLFGQYSANNHSANFQNLPGAFTCGSNYTSGSGGGIALGGLYELPLADALKLSLRADYVSDKATLRSSESQLLGINGEAQNGTFEKSLTAEISSIGIQPLIGYELYSGLNLHAGARLGFLMQKSYEQKEQILSPGDAVFEENKTRTRNESSGDIENTSALQVSLLGGISYDLPLNSAGTFIASPEIFYSLGLTSFVSDVDWTGSALRAGIAFKFSPAAQPSLPHAEPVAPVPPPTPPQPPVLAASIEAVGVSESGTEIPAPSIQVEEFLRRQSQPLLPYIFFDENSTEIPARYSRKTKNDAAAFAMSDLYSRQTLEAYYEILNIIGKRLQENPSASITVSGYNSNTGIEKNNTALSKQRAESIKNYLTTVWNISSAKINVRSQNLPPLPSNIQEPDGIAENRRVEISASSAEILAPLVLNDTLRRATPRSIRFKTSAESGAGISSWNISLMNPRGRVLKDISGSGEIARLFDVETEQISMELKPDMSHVAYSIETRDKIGQVFKTEKQIPVEIKTIESKRNTSSADKEIENYILMLFEFDKAELSAENEKITRSIKSAIKLASQVTVTGYSDRFGSEDYNLRLSENRARNVAKLLGVPAERAKGVGESILLYDNNLPEGRFYSRTINITVETPIVK